MIETILIGVELGARLWLYLDAEAIEQPVWPIGE
jgi:hypothetical protein